jgi:hypothetical protein
MDDGSDVDGLTILCVRVCLCVRGYVVLWQPAGASSLVRARGVARQLKFPAAGSPGELGTTMMMVMMMMIMMMTTMMTAMVVVMTMVNRVYSGALALAPSRNLADDIHRLWRQQRGMSAAIGRRGERQAAITACVCA